MASEKKKVFEQIQKGFQEDTIAGAKLKKDLPLLATNLNNPKHLDFLFKEYKKQGLIPDKLGKDTINNAEDLTRYLQKRIYAEWDGIVKKDPKIKGDKGFRKAYFARERTKILNNIVQNEALSKLTEAQKTPEQLEQIGKMRWKGLPIKVNSRGKLSFNRRYYHDKVSKPIIEYANNLKPGLGDQWAKEMRASWNVIGKRNQALKASSGLGFDIGHFIPSILDAPNVGSNAAPEPLGINRSKGGTPFTSKRALARQLGIPETWMQSFTDWYLRQEGLDPNLLEKDYQLKGGQIVDSATGYSDPNAEIAKNQAKFKADQELIDVVEGYKQQGIIPPETTVIGKDADIKSIDDIKKYSSAERSLPGYEIKDSKFVKKVTQPNQTQEILKVVKQNPEAKPVYESIVNGKNIKQTITGLSKVIDRIPTKVKLGGAIGLGGMGFLGDTSAIAKSLLDGEESIEQQKANDLQAASGVLGHATWKFPPMWAPAAMMWGLAEMKQWQVDMKELKAEDRELWYMTKGIQGQDEEGNLVTPEWGSGKRRTGRFKR